MSSGDPATGGAAARPAGEIVEKPQAPPPGAEAHIAEFLGAAEPPQQVGADFAPISSESKPAPDADPYQHDSLAAQLAFDQAAEAAARGDEETAVRHYLKASKLAETAREWYLQAVSCYRVGEFLLNPRPPCDLERALRMFRRAVAAYERSGLFAEARDLAVRVAVLRMRRGEELGIRPMPRYAMRVAWLTTGLGHRPSRLIVTAIAVVLLYGAAFWAVDGVHSPSAPHEETTLWTAVYFSGITFATVGYGDFVPAPHARWIALTEGAVGAFTLGFFVAVLAHRLSQT